MKSNLLLAALCVAFDFGLQAQTEPETKLWSLQECVEYAVENNLTVRSQTIQTAIDQENYLQAKQAWYPTLNAQVSYNGGWGLNTNPVTNINTTEFTGQNSYWIGTNVPISRGGQIHNQTLQSEVNYNASQLDLEKAKNDLALTVALDYVNILLGKEQLRVALEQRDITQQQVDRTSKLVDAGSSPQGELYEIEAQLAQENQNVIVARNNVNLSLLQLAQRLQLDDYTGFDVETPEIEMPDPTLLNYTAYEIYQTALNTQPDLPAAEARVQSAQLDEKISSAGYIPSISLSSNFSSFWTNRLKTDPFTGEANTYGDQLSENWNTGVGVNMSIPILNRRQNKSNVNRSHLNYLRAVNNRENVKNQLLQRIQQAHADAVAALKAYDAAQVAVKSNREAFKYTEERYNVGVVNVVDYNVAKNNLTRAESSLLRAKYDYIFKYRVLDFYYGNMQLR
ncbi:MAG: TolC family protein [Flavobacteriales bacterium]|nr:TolC family protein [Flavobacteriales bacterium]